MNNNFTEWLSKYLETTQHEAQKLLDNETSRYFLIVWSIFEFKCFGFITPGKIKDYSSKNYFQTKENEIEEYSQFFHERYQDKKKYINLIFDEKYDNKEFKNTITKAYKDLEKKDKIFLLLFVVYRYRNNIFHGTKGISSWLKFKVEIEKCISLMQLFIDNYKNSV